MFLKKPWFWILVVVVVVGAGGWLTAQKQAAVAKAKAAAAAKKPLETPYATIARGKADVEGAIISVPARRAGIVREVLVQEGDVVTKGQILARQEDDDARLALKTTEAQLSQSRAQIALTQVNLASAEREYRRLLPLAPSNFVARQKLDQAQDAIKQAQAQLATDQTAVTTSQAEVA